MAAKPIRANAVLFSSNPNFEVFTNQSGDQESVLFDSNMTADEALLWAAANEGSDIVNKHYKNAMPTVNTYIVCLHGPGQQKAVGWFYGNFQESQAPLLGIEVEYDNGTFVQRVFSKNREVNVQLPVIKWLDLKAPLNKTVVAQYLFNFMSAKNTSTGGGTSPGCGIVGTFFPSLCNVDRFIWLGLAVFAGFGAARTKSKAARVGLFVGCGLALNEFWVKGGLATLKSGKK